MNTKREPVGQCPITMYEREVWEVFLEAVQSAGSAMTPAFTAVCEDYRRGKVCDQYVLAVAADILLPRAAQRLLAWWVKVAMINRAVIGSE